MRENTLLRRVGSIFLAFVMAVVMLTPSAALAKTENTPAPEVKSITKAGSLVNSYYRVEFKDGAEAFVKAMKNGTITLNGTEATYKGSLYNEKKSYKFSNNVSFGGPEIYIDFTPDSFEGTVTVVAKAAGYSDLTFTVKDGKLQETVTPGPGPVDPSPEAPADKTAPKAVKSEFKSEILGAKYYRVSFEKSENVTPFLDGITKVTANNEELKSVHAFGTSEVKSYKLANDMATGGGYIFMDFSEDVFKGKDVKVTVESTGFTPLTFNVKDGKIVDGAVDPVEPEAPKDAELVTTTKKVDLGWAKFLVIDLEDKYNIDNVKFAVDGTEVETTKVTDDGNIVKWEVSALEHKDLVVTTKDGKEKQELVIGKKAGTVEKSEKTLPDYFMANGLVYTWDYYLRNFDDNGNVRITPSKTTFNMDGKTTPIVKSFSPDAVLTIDENGKGSGEVELMFNYEKGTAEEKAFVDGISDVDLVAFNEYRNTLNDNLKYTLDKNFTHGNKTVACVKVPLGQSNLNATGRYYLRVTSNGNGNLFPIHVVSNEVPTMTLTTQRPTSGQDVKFRVNNMTYGITMPIYRVVLTDPEGTETELAKIDDYYLLGDLFTIYNDKTNHLEKSGTYTVEVYATGFKPFSKKFSVGAATKNAPAKTMSLDGIATASVSGGDSGDGGDAGGSEQMNANLIFNTDLLVNAEILVKMGIDNPLAKGISDRWNSMTAVSVYNAGSKNVYDAASYFDAVNGAETEGKYLTFKEYTAREDAKLTTNRPYSVKEVLEDNLLGDISSFGEASGLAAPDMVLLSVEGKKVVFSCEDTAYLKAIQESGVLSLNSPYGSIAKDQYSVDLDKKTLTINNAAYGDNTLTIKADGYKLFKLVFECKKVNEITDLQITGSKIGEDVVIECKAHNDGTSCDFLANLKAVKVTAPTGIVHAILPNGQEAVDTGYVKEGNKLTILGKSFTEEWAQQPGPYKVTLESDTYEAVTLTVKLEKADEIVTPDQETIAAPTVKEIKEAGSLILGKYDRVEFNGDAKDVDKYINAITGITVNGKAVEKTPNLFNSTNSYNFGANGFGEEIYVDFSKDCFKGAAKVVISATGYENLVFNVKDGKLVSGEVTPEPEKPAVVKNIKIKTDYGLVKVTFNKSANAKTYRIAYRYVLDGKYSKWSYKNIDTTEAVIKGLKKGIGYEFRVAAVDGKVRSDYAKADRLYYTNRGGDRAAAMKSARIEKAYTKNGAVKLTARDIKYKTAPQTVKYKFAYRVKGTKTWKYTTYSPNNIKTIKGLKKGKTYTFAVAYAYKSAVDNTTYVYSKYAYKNVKVK